ncbi:MAG: hypothetical protein JSS93_08320 [Bacteroidetes bacterium]|nr:hypothetical protein [Bacteroidota bacterium]
MKFYKKIAIGALLSLYILSLLCISTGFFLASHRSSFQKWVKADDTKTIILTLTAEEFRSVQWAEPNVEFERNGKMYDVANIVYKSNTVEIYCQNDLFEEMFISYLKQFDTKTGNNTMPYVQFYESIVVFTCSSAISSIPEMNRAADLYSSLPPNLITPPPRTIF